MPTRRVLKSIAHDLLASFLSRNNAIDGYWALGRFYAYLCQRAQAEDLSPVVEFDLINAVSWPDTPAFGALALDYARRLGVQLVSRGIPRQRLVAASLRIRFETGSVSGAGRGEPFQARLELLDDRGHCHLARRTGRCAPHDPALERQSGREPGSGAYLGHRNRL